MIRKIINPFAESGPEGCFGCSTNNHAGLEMEFFEDGEFLLSNWTPKQVFGGFKNVLHGGIISTIHDEIACWYIFAKIGTSGVTTQLNTTYLKPLFTDKGGLQIRAKLISRDKKYVEIHSQIFNPEGELCSQADIKYRYYPLELAKKKLYYPGIEAFFEK